MSDNPTESDFSRFPAYVPRDSPTEAIRELVELALDKAADLDDLDATRAIAQTVRAWLASVDALDSLPTSPDVLACQRWRNNAEMIAAVLGLLDDTGQIPAGPWVDLTYGEHGGWWLPRWNRPPARLVRCIGPMTGELTPKPVYRVDEKVDVEYEEYRIDFTDCPFKDDLFAVTCFDPPYVLKGGRGAYDGANSRYGVGHALPRDTGGMTRREQLTNLITDGYHEAVRITKPGGIIIAKGGRGIDGGKLFRTDDLLIRLADDDPSVEVLFEMVYTTVPRSQAHRGKQLNPRSNCSKAPVLRKVSP